MEIDGGVTKKSAGFFARVCSAFLTGPNGDVNLTSAGAKQMLGPWSTNRIS
jgi:hypothetical protein